MRIEIETPAYDSRRFHKPWCARVSFGDCAGDFHWGQWVGIPGGEGILVIECTPGDIVARGQKDTCGPSANSAPTFFVATETGELERLPNRAAAYKMWHHKKNGTGPYHIYDYGKEDARQTGSPTSPPPDR